MFSGSKRVCGNLRGGAGFFAWRFILPLAMMYVGGLGVFYQIPKRLAVAYPKLAVYLFVSGGPMLFVALLITHLAVTLISLVVLSAIACSQQLLGIYGDE